MGTEVEDDAAAEAAFNEGSGNTEEQAANPTATPETQAATETPAEVVAPKYVQITEEQFNALNAKVASIDEMKATMEKSFGTAFGKIGGLERKQSAIEEWKANQGITGDLSEDDFTELKEAFPELAAMQVKGLNRSLAKLKANPAAAAIDPAKVNDLVQQGIALKLQERELEQQQGAVKALETEHADWREVKDKPEFKAWMEKQPQRVQKTYAKTWDSDFLSDVFGSFKAAVARAKEASDKAAAELASKSSTTRKDRLAAAVNPRGTGGHAPGPSEDDDFLAGFNSGRT